MPAFPGIRRSLDQAFSRVTLATALTIAAILPWIVVTLRLGTFRLISLALLTGIALIISFWYVWLRPSIWVDLVLLAFIAAVVLSRVLDSIYGEPARHVPLQILGHLMLIRTGAMAVLLIRRLDVVFGFVPNGLEWLTGVQYFAYFMPVGIILGWALHIVRFHPAAMVWWKLPGYAVLIYFGALWVIALGEEFFFRAFLQHVLMRSLGSETIGLLLASLLFGAAHLPFRFFPNWRFAILAGILGLFCGMAYIRARSMRASMVTHALAVTAWRLLFT